MIESILLGLPIPEIYLQQLTRPNGQTEHVVVDGQQRIRAVLEFVGAGDAPGFELDYLASNSPFLHRSYGDLSDEERTRFFQYRLSIRFLDEATDADVQDLFLRINRYLTKLSNQELRNATYSGPFARMAETLADDSYWASNAIVGPQSIRRMGDIEFVADLLIGAMHGPQGGDPKTLDQYYAILEEYEEEFPDQVQVRKTFLRTRDTIEAVYPDIKSARWHNKTDFYTLFVGLAGVLKGAPLAIGETSRMREVLDAFQSQIDARLRDDEIQVPEAAQQYVRAVQKGSSDRSRRTARHQAMTAVLGEVIRST